MEKVHPQIFHHCSVVSPQELKCGFIELKITDYISVMSVLVSPQSWTPSVRGDWLPLVFLLFSFLIFVSMILQRECRYWLSSISSGYFIWSWIHTASINIDIKTGLQTWVLLNRLLYFNWTDFDDHILMVKWIRFWWSHFLKISLMVTEKGFFISFFFMRWNLEEDQSKDSFKRRERWTVLWSDMSVQHSAT